MKKLTKLNNAKVLSKEEQKNIDGSGVSKGGGIIVTIPGVTGPGQSQLCWSRPSGYHVIIDGHTAVCTGNGGGYWFP